MKTQNDFGVGSVKKLILSQALPLTVAQTVQLLYNIVDRIYIGHLEGIGDLALTGLGIGAAYAFYAAFLCFDNIQNYQSQNNSYNCNNNEIIHMYFSLN